MSEKLLGIVCGVSAAFVLLWAGGCAGQKATKMARPQGESLAIEQISHARHLLRSACGNLSAVNSGAPDRAARMETAQNLTSSALEEWRRFLAYWANQAPQAYAKHPDWPAATSEVTHGIAEMLKQIRQGNPTAAFRACGLFVTLNETAGVRRTSDVLFQFRKAAKPLAQAVVQGELEVITAKLDQLAHLRDKAMSEPVGGTGTSAQKAAALRAFSEAVDAFASTVRADDGKQLDTQYREMMSSIEAAYDLCL